MRPTTTHIMGMKYSITYEKSTLNRSALGFIEFWQSEITISGESSEDQQKQTLIHEVLHAFDMKMSVDVSEEQNSMRSNILFAWLRDPANLAAIEWIMADGPERKGAKNANR